MITQVTKGIKISVVTLVLKAHSSRTTKCILHSGILLPLKIKARILFNLTSRHWEIYDSLNDFEVLDGEGVIGKKPVIKPGESHTYSSGCLLASPIGAMKGHYNMVNFTSTEKFRVYVPTFKFSAPFALN